MKNVAFSFKLQTTTTTSIKHEDNNHKTDDDDDDDDNDDYYDDEKKYSHRRSNKKATDYLVNKRKRLTKHEVKCESHLNDREDGELSSNDDDYNDDDAKLADAVKHSTDKLQKFDNFDVNIDRHYEGEMRMSKFGV